jgi:hypothetical protein
LLPDQRAAQRIQQGLRRQRCDLFVEIGSPQKCAIDVQIVRERGGYSVVLSTP